MERWSTFSIIIEIGVPVVTWPGGARRTRRRGSHRVRLLALGDEARPAGPAPVQPVLDVGLGEGDPGGQPSTTQPSAGPWLSPQVVTRNRWPKVLCDMICFLQLGFYLSLP